MKKILLVAVGTAILAGANSVVRADNMGNISGMKPGMNMGGMEQTNHPMENTNNVNASVKSYPALGVVEKIAPDLRTATIHHENIPGYMAAMTMDFRVSSTNELKGVSPGDQITFKLMVGTNYDEWIEDIKRTGRTMPVMTNSMSSMGAPVMGK